MVLIYSRSDLGKANSNMALEDITSNHMMRPTKDKFDAAVIIFYDRWSDGYKVLKNRFDDSAQDVLDNPQIFNKYNKGQILDLIKDYA